MAKGTTEVSVTTDLAIQLAALHDLAHKKGMEVEDLLRVMLRSFDKRPLYHGLQDDFNFGKYYGLNIEDVIRADPRYMYWLVNTSEWFRLSGDALEILSEYEHLWEGDKACR